MLDSREKRVLYLLFFTSGISGLLYEVVWLRMISRITGVTVYATSITLAAFMAGLAVGSYIIGRFIDGRKDHLKIFACLELFVGITAVIIPSALKYFTALYAYLCRLSNYPTVYVVFFSMAVPFFILLIPTMLMGGTLPVLISYLSSEEKKFGKNLSLLYGLNTLGAVLGVLLSGFITIGEIGELNTILIGLYINIFVSLSSYMLYRKYRRTGTATCPPDKINSDNNISVYSDSIRRLVLISIFISGYTALAYEVVWSRQLILFLRTSIYAFSAVLAVFLTGISVGSIVINRCIDRIKEPLQMLGRLELAAGILSIAILYVIPYFDISIITKILSPVIIVFPLTFLFGMVFPAASECYTKSRTSAGSSVGKLYSFNTAGNIAGALITGFICIDLIGSSKTIILLGLVNIFLGMILLNIKDFSMRRTFLRSGWVLLLIILAVYGLKNKDPFLSIIEKRINNMNPDYKIFYNRETVQGTVTSFRTGKIKQLYLNGIGQSHLCTETKLMAHLPVILSGKQDEFLMICFGMGTTLKSAGIYKDMNITSVELVPEIYKCFKFYHEDAKELLNRKKTKLYCDDGRNFLLRSSKKYDIITVDPSPPVYSAGTVNLYTKEFIALCREHLTLEGVMCLWFPGGTYLDDKYILKTFYSVFPETLVWVGPHGWGYYIIGFNNRINDVETRIRNAFKEPALVKDLKEFDSSCITADKLIEMLILAPKKIEIVTKNGLVITDNNPYTEFPLWRYMERRYRDRY